ncbi:membrane protein DedA, SNARE-associated domain [Sporobacter termitidis DSM 10068]|uniref:Membrane protein DedA, SNARE-associated domain n=1 Tax=Sporobacter termitidis DSM 10068 TaxID=1123282 RepID=A0A1M5VI72_9FIRM|nr:DedA family protein [Sporobacter termitidis]SHH74946.1 membrane protein DedA, SNARE-associated domain [Sporobacter termitidis DSM 10068]
MQDWIIDIMNQFGYLGIALLIAIENIFPPIPSELILTFGGFMTTYTNMNIWIVALSATIGSVAGAIILYGVGRLLTVERLEWIIGKWGHVLRLKKEDVKRAEDWFIRRGTSSIFFCRFIPIVRSLISIPAGMARLRGGKFLLFTTLGTAIWNVVLVCLGAFAGAGWERINKYMDVYSYVALGAMAVIGIGFILWFIKKRKARSEIQNNDGD